MDNNQGFTTVVGPERRKQGKTQFPILFPNWRMLPSRDELFDYLKQGLEKMAEEGTLSVTALHNQPVPVPDYCGMIIMGNRFAEGNDRMIGAIIPRVLKNYRVKIRARKEGATIGWKLGRESGRTLDVGYGAIKKYEDVYTTSNLTEAELALDDAWVCLHQHGAHCVSARSRRRQEKLWMFEEVLPEVEATPVDGDIAEESPPHRRKPGRPRKK